MQFEECLAEAGREGGRGLGDAALRAGELGGEAREEVVLRLLGVEDAHGRQYAEGVGTEEDDVLRSGTGALASHGKHDFLDVLDGIADARVLGHALVGEVDFAVFGHGDVLEQCVALDGVVDVGLAFFVEVDDLGIAAAFEVEDAIVVPSVLVVADEQALRVSGEGGLTRARESEEDGGVFALHVGVGRAVHRGDALERQEVVHHREHAFLHLAAVPRVDDDLLFRGDVEGHAGFRVQAEFLVVLDFGFRSVIDDEVGREVFEFGLGGADEHILHEMSLPGHFHDEAHGHARVFVGTAEAVDDEQALVAEFLLGDVFHHLPSLLRGGMVVVLVFLAGPPYGVFRVFIHDDELILGRAARVDARHHVHGVEFGQFAHLEALKSFLGFLLEELLVRGVVNHFRSAGDTVLLQD